MLKCQPYLDLIGQAVREERERRGWNLSDLMEHSLVDRSHLSFVERGQSCISMETLIQLAEALEVSPLFLMCSKERPLRGLLRSPKPILAEDQIMELLTQATAGAVIHQPSLDTPALRKFAQALLEGPEQALMSHSVLKVWLAQEADS